jgi:mono/diheme cytochrome c family protein
MARLERKSWYLGDLVGAGFAVLLVGCGNEENLDHSPDPADLGKTRFENYCAACNQLGGLGIEGRVPPLDGSPWVAGSESRLIRIVLHGLRGPIKIGGQTYNLEMPSFGQAFKDDEIASMLSYVRSRYGEPSPPITAATVSQVRAATQNRSQYWTVDELLDVP